jgi:hypothetical protein
MKCIKSIKASNTTEVGIYVRTTETEAETKVKTGFWAYAPKTEYKTWKRGGSVEVVTPQSNEETTKQIKVKKKTK